MSVNDSHRVPPIALDQTLLQRLNTCVAAFPQVTAIRDEDGTLSYAELSTLIDDLARQLLQHTCPPGSTIVVFPAHNRAAPAAIFAVMRINCVCCAVDPQLPAARIAQLLELLQPALLLIDHTVAPDLPPGAPDVIRFDHTEAHSAADTALPPVPTDPDQPAFIAFSSGTSTVPKALLRSHRPLSFTALIHTRGAQPGPHSRVSQLYPAPYGPAMGDICSALLHGATLVVADPRRLGARDLAEWIAAERISHLHLHASLLNEIETALPDDRCLPDLQLVRPSDQVSGVLIRRFARRLSPACLVAHSYSSAEAGPVTRLLQPAHSSWPDGPLSVGVVQPEVELRLIGEDGTAVAPGEIGRIQLRGFTFSLGYLGQPELTAQMYRRDPTDPRLTIFTSNDFARLRDDGSLELAGRADRRVKIRGHSVGLDTLENALIALPGVHDAAVVAHRSADGHSRLVAYVAGYGTPLQPESLFTALSSRYEAALLPARILTLAHIPRLPSGKIDYRALPPPGRHRPLQHPARQPVTPLEQTICRIWADVLDLDHVGLDDRFDALGGDSLNAMRMMVRLEQALGRSLSSDLLAAATAAELVERLQQQTLSAEQVVDPTPVRRRKPDPRGRLEQILPQLPLLPAIAVVLLHHRLGFVGAAQRGVRQSIQQLTPTDRHIALIGNQLFSGAVLEPLRGALRAAPDDDPLQVLRRQPQRLWRSVAAAWQSRIPPQFNGLQYLEQQLAESGAALFVEYHTTVSTLGLRMLAARVGIPPIERISQGLARTDLIADAQRAHGAELLRAHHLLLQRRSVTFTADLHQPNHPAARPVLIGRQQRRLATGFAELALLQQRPPLPVVMLIDGRGQLHVRIEPPLVLPPAELPHEQRIDLLTAQYGRFLHRYWTEQPGSLNWNLIRHELWYLRSGELLQR